MDGPIDWWWKMNLLDVCVQVGFCQIRSQLTNTLITVTYSYCFAVCRHLLSRPCDKAKISQVPEIIGTNHRSHTDR